jgi:O-methyltransferase
LNPFIGELIRELRRRVAEQDPRSIAVLGMGEGALAAVAELRRLGMEERLVGVFTPGEESVSPPAAPWNALGETTHELVVVAVDAGKEKLLRSYASELAGTPAPAVVLAGTEHLEFHDEVYLELDAPALVPSYATGYRLTRVHIYQCLKAAASAGLSGAVVELGAFKGGTSAWLARTVKRLGLDARVIAFDTWEGFPPRRSLFDLYEHPRCVFTDLLAVRAYLEPLGVEVVAGDITETAPARLADEPVLLAFADTDNYSGTRAALETILPKLVRGGAIVLDHYWTTSDYLYTIGERMAAEDVLGEAGLLQLQGTGVFVKLR